MADNTKTIKTRIQHKTDTTDAFNGADFIPLKGELLVFMDSETSSPVLKVGNGVDIPKDLPSISGSGTDSTIYETKEDALAKLTEAKNHTDEAVAQKSQVQIIIWEEND